MTISCASNTIPICIYMCELSRNQNNSEGKFRRKKTDATNYHLKGVPHGSDIGFNVFMRVFHPVLTFHDGPLVAKKNWDRALISSFDTWQRTVQLKINS
jgi:hypothetical protein